MTTFDATYSPEDNKLRLYASSRLDAETYARVTRAGFKWAPKQKLFVAPKWTPGRAALCVELAGEIGDEDKSLVDRAEDRAERFEEYSDKRRADSEAAHRAVSAIADNIPLGQPILVGHHSERRARKDAERIENGMRKVVKMWETSNYWKARAAGAIAAAKYKELPRTRARRIKTLEADRRQYQRFIDKAKRFAEAWQKNGGTLEGAKAIANRDFIWRKFPLADYPRQPPASQYEDNMSLWSALDGGVITAAQAQEIAIKAHQWTIDYYPQWIAHLDNRLLYERAMLEEAGASDLIVPKAKPKQLPICNYRAPEGIETQSPYRRGELDRLPQIEMTKAEYSKIYEDYKGTRVVERSHRVRVAMHRESGALSMACVFLTDSKVHKKPEPVEANPAEPVAPVVPMIRGTVDTVDSEPDPQAEKIEAMRATLREGVQVVSAPQLFPTPAPVVARMIELARIEPGHRVLEPSAGTGAILDALEPIGCDLTAVEFNSTLANGLIRRFPRARVLQFDFLELGPDDLGTFDRILMNPPFKDGADIRHIQRARSMLKPGGRLVAICANGPRQHDALRPMTSDWQPLPRATFAGTDVGTVLLTIQTA